MYLAIWVEPVQRMHPRIAPLDRHGPLMVSPAHWEKNFIFLTPLRCSDPLFFMHHAVSITDSFVPALTFCFPRQMVDKVWYDWQHRDPENAKSFFGGSVQALESVAEYNQYPNGGPPFLNVRSYSSYSRPKELKRCVCLAEFDVAGGWNIPRIYNRRRDGYDQWDLVLCL
jgi:hypothetical protein